MAGYPVLPTRYTPPSTHPGTIPRLAARAVASGACAGGARGACTYGRFGIPVGEPRGVEYRPVLGSRAGYIQLFEVRRVYTAV